jgi:hypothetical protein
LADQSPAARTDHEEHCFDAATSVPTDLGPSQILRAFFGNACYRFTNLTVIIAGGIGIATISGGRRHPTVSCGPMGVASRCKGLTARARRAVRAKRPSTAKVPRCGDQDAAIPKNCVVSRNRLFLSRLVGGRGITFRNVRDRQTNTKKPIQDNQKGIRVEATRSVCGRSRGRCLLRRARLPQLNRDLQTILGKGV